MARVLLLAGHETMEPILTAAGHAIVHDIDAPHDLVIASAPMPTHGRPVIVFTTPGDVSARIHALRLGASDAFDARFAHSQIAARVDAVAVRAAADEMVDWIYSELFLMPPDDPFLGLAAPDAFSALPA